MNHKSAWAEEEKAPSKEASIAEQKREPKRIIVSNSKPSTQQNSNYPKDTLIVASKLKAYVKERYDMNTSAGVMDKLSDLVREIADQAVSNAKNEGRKTLMDRDF
tara:strand:+ start:1279 stop:1593 length:315 start_codon:yes stop_codon:yes gene_type:complete